MKTYYSFLCSYYRFDQGDSATAYSIRIISTGSFKYAIVSDVVKVKNWRKVEILFSNIS